MIKIGDDTKCHHQTTVLGKSAKSIGSAIIIYSTVCNSASILHPTTKILSVIEFIYLSLKNLNHFPFKVQNNIGMSL